MERAINRKQFIAEATSDEQGASYRDGFVGIPFAPREFACLVESCDAIPCGRPTKRAGGAPGESDGVNERP